MKSPRTIPRVPLTSHSIFRLILLVLLFRHLDANKLIPKKIDANMVEYNVDASTGLNSTKAHSKFSDINCSFVEHAAMIASHTIRISSNQSSKGALFATRTAKGNNANMLDVFEDAYALVNAFERKPQNSVKQVVDDTVHGVMGKDNVAERPQDKMYVVMIVGGVFAAGVGIWCFIRKSRQMVDDISDDEDEDKKNMAMPPALQPGMAPAMMQPAMQPGMQPMMMQPGMQPMQPMMMNPGQPLMMNPGMQPVMMQTGMQPSMVPMQSGMQQGYY